MFKDYGKLCIIWVFVIIFALITASISPPIVKEEFDLYHSYEYSQMYLEDDPYTDLIIEYDYQIGSKPVQESLDLLEERVNQYTDKERVKIELGDELPYNETVTRSPYDTNDIEEIRDEYRDYERDGNKISIYILNLNGTWAEREGTLGIAERPHTIVVFQREIYEITQRTDLKREDIEPSILIHEFGHLLSLVGINYESDHEDPAYPRHCDESEGECVMAGSLEIKDGMEEEPPTDFCELCQEDIELIRNKEAPLGLEDVISYSMIALEFSIGLWVSALVIDNAGKKYRRDKYKRYPGFTYKSNTQKAYDNKAYDHSSSKEDEEYY